MNIDIVILEYGHDASLHQRLTYLEQLLPHYMLETSLQ